METVASEKRKHRRVAYIVNCMIRREEEPGFKQYNTLNVSRGGMFIKTSEPFPLRTDIHFKLLNTEGQLLFTGSGTVMWRHVVKNPVKSILMPGIGIKFTDIIPETSIDFEKFIETIELL